MGFKRPYKYSYSVYTSASQYQEGDYFQAKVCTIWAHGPVNRKPYRTFINPLKGTLEGPLKLK